MVLGYYKFNKSIINTIIIILVIIITLIVTIFYLNKGDETNYINNKSNYTINYTEVKVEQINWNTCNEDYEIFCNALSEGNPSLCEGIIREERREECISNSLLSKFDPEDVNSCNELEPESWKILCIGSITEDISVCSKLNKTQKEICEDILLGNCDTIVNVGEAKETCEGFAIMMYALKNKDPEICKERGDRTAGYCQAMISKDKQKCIEFMNKHCNGN